MSWSAAACKCCTAMCSCSVKATPQCPQPPHSALLAAHRAGSPEVLLSARAASGMLKRSAYEKTEDFRKYFYLITQKTMWFFASQLKENHISNVLMPAVLHGVLQALSVLAQFWLGKELSALSLLLDVLQWPSAPSRHVVTAKPPLLVAVGGTACAQPQGQQHWVHEQAGRWMLVLHHKVLSLWRG